MPSESDIERIRPYISIHTELGMVPREWLKNIEPSIEREEYYHPCWFWTGAYRHGHPIVVIKREDKKYSTIRAARYVANLFYSFPKEFDVIHSCGNISCLNPLHLIPTARHYRQRSRDIPIFKPRKKTYAKRRTGSFGKTGY